MSLKIRLSKPKKTSDFFKIVVCETRSKRDGKTVDILGFCNPKTIPPTLSIDEKKYRQWISKGAKPTKILQRLLVK